MPADYRMLARQINSSITLEQRRLLKELLNEVRSTIIGSNKRADICAILESYQNIIGGSFCIDEENFSDFNKTLYAEYIKSRKSDKTPAGITHWETYLPLTLAFLADVSHSDLSKIFKGKSIVIPVYDRVRPAQVEKLFEDEGMQIASRESRQKDESIVDFTVSSIERTVGRFGSQFSKDIDNLSNRIKDSINFHERNAMKRSAEIERSEIRRSQEINENIESVPHKTINMGLPIFRKSLVVVSILAILVASVSVILIQNDNHHNRKRDESSILLKYANNQDSIIRNKIYESSIEDGIINPEKHSEVLRILGLSRLMASPSKTIEDLSRSMEIYPDNIENWDALISILSLFRQDKKLQAAITRYRAKFEGEGAQFLELFEIATMSSFSWDEWFSKWNSLETNGKRTLALLAFTPKIMGQIKDGFGNDTFQEIQDNVDCLEIPHIDVQKTCLVLIYAINTSFNQHEKAVKLASQLLNLSQSDNDRFLEIGAKKLLAESNLELSPQSWPQTINVLENLYAEAIQLYDDYTIFSIASELENVYRVNAADDEAAYKYSRIESDIYMRLPRVERESMAPILTVNVHREIRRGNHDYAKKLSSIIFESWNENGRTYIENIEFYKDLYSWAHHLNETDWLDISDAKYQEYFSLYYNYFDAHLRESEHSPISLLKFARRHQDWISFQISQSTKPDASLLFDSLVFDALRKKLAENDVKPFYGQYGVWFFEKLYEKSLFSEQEAEIFLESHEKYKSEDHHTEIWKLIHDIHSEHKNSVIYDESYYRALGLKAIIFKYSPVLISASEALLYTSLSKTLDPHLNQNLSAGDMSMEGGAEFLHKYFQIEENIELEWEDDVFPKYGFLWLKYAGTPYIRFVFSDLRLKKSNLIGAYGASAWIALTSYEDFTELRPFFSDTEFLPVLDDKICSAAQRFVEIAVSSRIKNRTLSMNAFRETMRCAQIRQEYDKVAALIAKYEQFFFDEPRECRECAGWHASPKDADFSAIEIPSD